MEAFQEDKEEAKYANEELLSSSTASGAITGNNQQKMYLVFAQIQP